MELSAVQLSRPKAVVEFVTEGRRHLGQVAAHRSVELLLAQVIQLHQPMGDPQLKGLRVEAESFSAVKAVRHHHRNVAN